MSERVPIAKVTDIPEGQAKPFMLAGRRVAVFNLDGQLYACSDVCPHAGAPLHQGFISQKRVICPWHGWTFDLEAVPGMEKDGVSRFRVSVEGDDVYLDSEPIEAGISP